MEEAPGKPLSCEEKEKVPGARGGLARSSDLLPGVLGRRVTPAGRGASDL